MATFYSLNNNNRFDQNCHEMIQRLYIPPYQENNFYSLKGISYEGTSD